MTIVPASIRNRNPGAMYPGPSAKKFGSVAFETLRSKDGVHKIATFPSHVHGAAAMFDLLEKRYTGKTIRDAITTWCGGYYAGIYLTVLEAKGGVKSTDTLTVAMVRDAAVAVPLCRAMAWQEAGRDYPLDDAGWQEAHRMAFAGAVAPAWTPDNDVPSPRPETRAAEARGWWMRVTGWSSAAVTAVVGAVEPLYRGALDVLARLTELAPLKSAFVEAGANARAIGLGVLAAAIFAALGKLAGKEE